MKTAIEKEACTIGPKPMQNQYKNQNPMKALKRQ